MKIGRSPRALPTATAVLLVLLATGCSGEGAGNGGRPPGSRGGPGGGRPSHGGGEAAAAVPVEVASAVRRSISSYIETNGTLEAENEVDVVARASGPIVELKTEEGMQVRKGQLLARLEQDEIRSQLDISRVNLNEATLAYERAQSLQDDDLISVETFEQARAAHDSAKAQFEGNEIQLGYTEIRAPFGGLIVSRYVDFAQQVSINTPLFRISDFTPLLCPIQVPERDLQKLRVAQEAYLTVEAFQGEKFPASVLRISPVVDAATGTVKVTLEVEGKQKLRPGMFARVYLEIDSHDRAVVVPKSALSLESIGDTIYVAENQTTTRREVTLGFQEGDHVEILSGVDAGELVVVVGQDGLSNGTPIRVLRKDGATSEAPEAQSDPRPGRRGGPPDFATMTPEQLEQMKQRMKERGMTDAEIEERIKRGRERQAGR